MASNDNRGYIRETGTGTGQSGITVSVKKHSDSSTVTSDATDSNGLFEVDHDTAGYPGPSYWEATSGGDTIVRSGNITGQINGLFWAGDIPDVFQALGIGVVQGIGSEFAVSADGSDMNVDVAAGLLIHKDGVPYLLEAASAVTMTAADGSNDRIDTIVIQLTREGQSEQGAISLTKVDGTPAGSPSAPSLTQSSATWQYPLADILVGTGVSVIAADKVTDRRTFVGFPTTATADAVVITDSDGQLTFDTTLDAALIGTGVVSTTEFDYLNGVTSAIQTQLDAKVADYTQYFTASVNIGNETDVITSDEPEVVFALPEACTLIGFEIESDASGSITLDTEKASAGSTSYSDIDASAPVSLSSAQNRVDTTLTGWTTSMTQYDKIRTKVTGTPATVTRVQVHYRFSKARA